MTDTDYEAIVRQDLLTVRKLGRLHIKEAKEEIDKLKEKYWPSINRALDPVERSVIKHLFLQDMTVLKCSMHAEISPRTTNRILSSASRKIAADLRHNRGYGQQVKFISKEGGGKRCGLMTQQKPLTKTALRLENWKAYRLFSKA